MSRDTGILTLRLDEETFQLLDLLARKLGQKRTGIVRLAVRRLAEIEKVEPQPRKREDGR